MPLGNSECELSCRSIEYTDKAVEGIGNIVLSCCKVFAYSCFLTLFNDFLSQSRYADVNELVYVKARRPQ